MEQRMQAAAVITAALLRDHPLPSTEKIAELLDQSLEAVHIAIGLENRRLTQKQAELRKAAVVRR